MECNHKCNECPVGILLDWVKSTPEVKEMVRKTEVREFLNLIITEIAGPTGEIFAMIPMGLETLLNVSRLSFVAGYKRGLDTSKLDSLTMERKK